MRIISIAMDANRRSLVKGLAIGGATVLFAPHSLMASVRRPKNSLGVALVGLGYYSTDLLAPALQQTQHCYLAGIVTGTPEKAESWKKKFNLPEENIYNYENFDSIANNDSIDVIYIVLPPSMHKEYVVRAANAGKHVWCEKPMAITALECEQMIQACSKNRVKLAIGYRCQHEPNTIDYRKIVKSDTLGKLKSVESAAGYFESRADHWKQKKEMGGGALYDMGVYAIQGARLGSGMEPVAVLEAAISTNRPEIYKNGLDETAIAKLAFPGGLVANVKTSFGESVNQLQVIGEKGKLQMAPFSAYEGIRGSSPLGAIQHPYKIPWQQARQMDDDSLAIINKQPMLVPGEEGLRDIRIVEAIYQSAERKGATVQL